MIDPDGLEVHPTVRTDWKSILRESKAIEFAARPQEQLLIDLLPAIEARKVLAFSVGMGQLAAAAALRFPKAQVICQYLDLYHAEQARFELAARPSNLEVVCEADIAIQGNQLVVLPVSAHGEAELVRDLMQQGYESLDIGGWLYTSTDNPRDTWLHGEMRKLFAGVSRKQFESGTVYAGRKTGPLKKKKSFAAEFQFRHASRLLKAVTRPGVFSHRHLDPGARHLMGAMGDVAGKRVLDIGCGCGAVGFAAASEGASVVAVDSSARAVECARRGAELNGLGSFVVDHSASGPQNRQAAFDVVLANPPYYANFRIAERFLEISKAALRPGGRVVVVTKSPQWYEENMERWFGEVRLELVKDYWIARGAK